MVFGSGGINIVVSREGKAVGRRRTGARKVVRPAVYSPWRPISSDPGHMRSELEEGYGCLRLRRLVVGGVKTVESILEFWKVFFDRIFPKRQT